MRGRKVFIQTTGEADQSESTVQREGCHGNKSNSSTLFMRKRQPLTRCLRFQVACLLRERK